MAGHQHTERVRYIYDTYIEPALKDVGRLLTHLADDGVIRRFPCERSTHGATAPYSLVPLAELVDPSHPASPKRSKTTRRWSRP
jgi:hypothetical protein